MNAHRSVIAAVLSTACIASTLAGSAAAEEPTYRLRYKFNPGETICWDVVHRSDVRTTVAGTTQRAESTSESVKLWRVTKVKPDGTATFVYSVDDVEMLQRMSGREEVRYNSKTDEEPPMGFENVAQAVGKPLSVVTLDPQGNVVEREQKHKSSVVEPREGDITIPLPEKRVPIGHRWSRPHDVQVKLDSGGMKTISTRQTFTLESVKTGVATISVRTNVLTPVSDPAIEAQLTSCAAEGHVRFDIDAGRVISQRLDTDKHVVGFRGDASSLHYRTRFSERLVDDEAARTARREE